MMCVREHEIEINLSGREGERERERETVREGMTMLQVNYISV